MAMQALAIILVVMLALLVLGVPISYAIAISSLAAILQTVPLDVSVLTAAQRTFVGMSKFSLTAIPFFILAGNLMNQGGIAKRLVDFVLAILGKLPGALLVTNVGTNALFGAISGSASAAAAAVGSMVREGEEEAGYDSAVCAATNAASAPSGAIKNIGMGCGSRAGKTEQHISGQPIIKAKKCRGCKKCLAQCANDGLVFDEQTRKMSVDKSNCVGCGRCLGACNFDAINFEDFHAPKLLNCKMAEYAKAVVAGRPHFHISLVVDVSPNCDCHAENDAPILPNIGMFASADPLALDQACVDACLAATPMPGSQLYDRMHSHNFCDHHDHFKNSTPESEWQSCLEHAEKIGLGSRQYELIK
ncbi:MAG: TRAP transporter large permease subunit [Alistipes sp.]|nr:TRAP transporter large permease subunit [Alistipes sp.]